MFLPFFSINQDSREFGITHGTGDALDPISIPVSAVSGFKNRLVLPHVQVPPTPFVTEVRYRESLPINMDGVMAIFEGDVYLISGVITCHTIDFPVIIVLEEQLG